MRNAIKTNVIALAAAACLVGGFSIVRAQDMSMSKDKDMMMKENMDMMKKMMSDPAMAPSAEDMAKAKAMQEMVMSMTNDPEMKKMSMDMMAKPDMKMMTPSADAVKMQKEALMKDPAAMKMVMAHAMMMTSMSADKPEMGTHGMPPTMNK